MATTRLIPMHVIKGQTVAQTVHDRLAYAVNPAKTKNKLLVSAYGCDPSTAAAEMLLCKREYEMVSGHRDEKRSDVVLYQIRQSFKPGEVTPEQAQKIGHDLAMSFTKGKYQFVVTTHVDHAHFHNHIIFNSTAIDHSGKFRNFKGSSCAIRNISDRLCLEHGLSVIDKLKAGREHYGKWLGDQKPLSWQDKLRDAIDLAIVHKPKDFEAFISSMESLGYEIKRGKHLSFRAQGQLKFTRLRSLGEGYSEDEIRSAICGSQVHLPRAKSTLKNDPRKVNLLVDIQEKLLAGKGAGYERWAKVFNLKQMAKTLNYLSENNLLDYASLENRAKEITSRYNELARQRKDLEKSLAEVTVLKSNIINYAKTRDVYAKYRLSGYGRKFHTDHSEEILLHLAAKKAFDQLQEKKIPSVKALNSEYFKLLAEKKSTYLMYAAERKKMREISIIKANVDSLLGFKPIQNERNNSPERFGIGS